MSQTLNFEKIQKNPRIASYEVPKATWVLALLIVCTAVVDRFLGNDATHAVVDVALIAVFVLNALEFVIPFLRPNSILGGAELKTAALAGAALLAWLA